MKAFTSSLLLSALLWVPGLAGAASDVNPAEAIIGTWVIDDEASWEQFSKSPEWTQMTPEQRVDFRAAMWPKALEKLLFTAYHFTADQIVIAHKKNQMAVPAQYARAGDNKLTVVMGEPPRTSNLTVTFYNADQINIRSAGELQPNYYVWKRRADKP